MYKKIVFAVFMLAASGVAACILNLAVSAFSLEFSLRPGGFVFFPAGPGNKAAAAVFRTQTFWTSTLGFDDTTTWSFTYLAGKGYPLLKNAGGQ